MFWISRSASAGLATNQQSPRLPTPLPPFVPLYLHVARKPMRRYADLDDAKRAADMAAIYGRGATVTRGEDGPVVYETRKERPA